MFLILRENFGTCAIIFADGKSTTYGTEQFTIGIAECFACIVTLGYYVKCEGIFGLGQEEIADFDIGISECRIRSGGNIGQTMIKHRSDCQVCDRIVYKGTAHLLGQQLFLLLKHKHDCTCGLLLILAYCIYGSGGILDLYKFARLRIFGHLNRAEDSLDLCFDVVGVNIAHDDDSLVVRTIPFFVVVTQDLWRGIIHDLQCAYSRDKL